MYDLSWKKAANEIIKDIKSCYNNVYSNLKFFRSPNTNPCNVKIEKFKMMKLIT